MAHPQSSPRGLVAYKRIDINGQELTANSTGLLVEGGLNLSSSSVYITVDSTGYLIGSRYISTNVTNNLTT